MRKASNFTRHSRRLMWLFRVIDYTILIVPLIIYILVALCDGDITTPKKITVVATISIAAIICMFNILSQKKLRCPIWIIFLGLYVAIDELIPLIIMVAAASILDEFIFTPLVSYYKTKTIANKAIDTRGI